MKSRFHEAAREELAEAISYYEGKTAGLGTRLLDEVRAAARYIEERPSAAPVIDLGVRAKVLVRFPYSLMYVIETHELFIVAVAHHSRRPGYWADRL